VGLALDNDRAGPLTPGMNIVALSRTLGPVGGDLETLKAGTYDAAEIFRQAPTTPRILGGVKLSDIIPAVPLTGDAAPNEAMVLTTETPDGPANGPAASRPGQSLAAQGDTTQGRIVRFKWRPKLISDPLGILDFKPNHFCQIDLEIRTTAHAAEAQTLFQGFISNAPPWGLISDLPDPTESGPWVGKDPAFTLRVFGRTAKIVEVDFVRFVMKFETGKDNYVNPVVGDVRFFGCLEFIDKLRKLLDSPTPPGAPKLRPIFSLSPSSLEVGLKLLFPEVHLTVFHLKNLMAGFSVLVPFKPLGADNMSSDTGSRAVRLQFRLAERENPFLLGIYCFGGGGFLTIGLGTDGLEWFEVALEFGLHAEGNVFIGKGVLEMMAGIYFKMRREVTAVDDDVAVELTGYFRARGQVSAVGIVTVSLEVYLGLTYESVGNKVVGQATVTLEIDVLFFSASFSFHVERQFSGSSQQSQQAASLRGMAASLPAGGPGIGFLDLMPSQEIWDDYAEAFAPVGG
jgi:hypothetical protein